MKRKPDVIVSESKPEEPAPNYDRWFRAEVQASLADTRPDVSHAEAMARIRNTICRARQSGHLGCSR